MYIPFLFVSVSFHIKALRFVRMQSFTKMTSFKLVHSSCVIISGPSRSGKTVFVKKLLDENIFEPQPQRVIYCYGAYQPIFREFNKNVEFEDGIPSYLHTVSDALIILDDLMDTLGSSSNFCQLFTRGSHHRNLSIIFIVQNLFHRGKEMRTIHLNSQYLVLYKNPRDKSQVMHLARQMFPGKTKAFQEIFQDATAPAYGYLLIDLRPQACERLRLRTGIFSQDKHYVYEPR